MNRSGVWSDYARHEARRAPWSATLAMALTGTVMVVLTHVLVPRLPSLAISFMQRGFRVDGMGAVLLLNDLMVVYLAPFFLGVAGLLRVVVAAREEHQLEMLLAKPVRPATFLAARTVPVLAAALVVGLVVAGATSVLVAPYAGAEPVTGLGAFGAGLTVTAVAVFELAVLSVVFVPMRDGFQALLVACAVWLAPLLPSAAFLYRPDAFEGHPVLVSLMLPALVRHEATAAWLGPAAIVLLTGMAALLVRAGGVLLARTGVD